MKRKVVVSPQISQAIRGFGLPREVLLRLLTELHAGLPDTYSVDQLHRTKDELKYLRRIIVPGISEEHLFVVVVDDSTSSDYLLITNIGHGIE